ncbi:hypothetical protein DVH24_027929 [Malus domestica]|uniref:Uncharacterized protein n=1 Tax=Malus domestica TaxID=3750 RepID=A0A498HD42_MALDO|nr:hypothetical protein DVH24_027929 [Malus domestica]
MVGLAFLTELAEAGADGVGCELWEGNDWGREVTRLWHETPFESTTLDSKFPIGELVAWCAYSDLAYVCRAAAIAVQMMEKFFSVSIT